MIQRAEALSRPDQEISWQRTRQESAELVQRVLEPESAAPPQRLRQLALALGLGVAAGIWPARQASLIPPADTLRAE